MKAVSFLVCAVACVGAAAGVGRAGERPSLTFGEVFDGRAFVVKDDAQILEIDLRGESPRAKRTDFFPLAVAYDFPPRWKIAFGWLVLCHEDLDSFPRGIRYRDINTKSVPLIGPDSKGLYIPGMGNDPWTDTYSQYHLIWVVYDCIRNYVNERDHVDDDDHPFSKYEFYFDLVPEKVGACRYFVLASEGLQLDIEAERKDSIGKPPLQGAVGHAAATCGSEWEHAKDPFKPMLGVWLKDKRGQWALVDQFKVPPFNERFHAFVKGTTYYFLTDAGKVYVSKKPDKGERKLESLWDNDHYPIVAAVVDADANKVFLFGKARKGDMLGKNFYWELAETVHRVDYEPSAVKPVDTVEPLKTVMEYARFLADEKQIKLEKK